MRKFEVSWKEFTGCVELVSTCLICIIGWCEVESIKARFTFWFSIAGVELSISGTLQGIGVNDEAWCESGCVGLKDHLYSWEFCRKDSFLLPVDQTTLMKSLCHPYIVSLDMMFRRQLPLPSALVLPTSNCNVFSNCPFLISVSFLTNWSWTFSDSALALLLATRLALNLVERLVLEVCWLYFQVNLFNQVVELFCRSVMTGQ